MIRITPEDKKYLEIQVGELHAYRNQHGWFAMYTDHLVRRMKLIMHALPADVTAMCDVGGGMSGMSIMINRAYGGNLTCDVLDGDGPPVVIHHNLPFSSHEQTKSFLLNNGVKHVNCFDSRNMPTRRYELITSFRAWGFHIEPERYIPFCRRALKGVLIVDVRTDKPEWLHEFVDAFGDGECLGSIGKGELWTFNW